MTGYGLMLNFTQATLYEYKQALKSISSQNSVWSESLCFPSNRTMLWIYSRIQQWGNLYIKVITQKSKSGI